MYSWLKILEVNRLKGEKQEEDFTVSDWRSLSIRFIAEVELISQNGEKKFIAVDAFPFFFELLKASLNVPLYKPFSIYIGEGWAIDGAPTRGGYNLQIIFEILERKNSLASKTLSIYETSLFTSLKLSDLATALEAIGVNPENYFSRFPPEDYRP